MAVFDGEIEADETYFGEHRKSKREQSAVGENDKIDTPSSIQHFSSTTDLQVYTPPYIRKSGL